MNVIVATDTLKPSSSDISQVMEAVISPRKFMDKNRLFLIQATVPS